MNEWNKEDFDRGWMGWDHRWNGINDTWVGLGLRCEALALWGSMVCCEARLDIRPAV